MGGSPCFVNVKATINHLSYYEQNLSNNSQAMLGMIAIALLGYKHRRS
ncbi:hypothetical protein [Okeania sp. KiyG1]|nr:hypothetical protein [Okeania sp. KiyG1]